MLTPPAATCIAWPEPAQRLSEASWLPSQSSLWGLPSGSTTRGQEPIYLAPPATSLHQLPTMLAVNGWPAPVLSHCWVVSLNSPWLETSELGQLWQLQYRVGTDFTVLLGSVPLTCLKPR